MRNLRVFCSAIAVIALVVVLAALLTPGSVAQDGKHIWQITAKAYSIADPSSKTMTVNIGIEGWSSDAERAELLTAAESGTEAVTKKLKEMPAIGYISMGTVRRDLHYIRQIQDGDETKIVFATNRIINYGEVRSPSNTQDYTVALGEVRFNKKGKGEGQLAPACEVTYNREANKLDVGNNALQPVRLAGVRAKQPK